MDLFPKPINHILKSGAFILKPNNTLSYAHEFEEEIKPILTFWESKWHFPLTKSAFAQINVVLDFECSDEQYHITVNEDQIVISAKTKKGIAYGISTFLKLIEENHEGFFIRSQEINDYPFFSYRGFLLDVSRHFFPVSTIKKMLDAMYELKLNVLHWHLSDDQGWRIESKVYPKLHELGSANKQFYFQSEILEIVAYAKARNIEIVPELDIPGHSTALLVAYPHLSHHENLSIKKNFGIAHEIMCLGNDELLPFLENLIEEMIPLFSCRFFHLGSDEAKLKECQSCPTCQNAKSENHLPNFLSLQIKLINELSDFLRTKKIEPIIWNDIAQNKLNSHLIIQHWKPFSWKRTLKSQQRGHSLILSPFFKYYLDYPYSLTNLKKVYSYNPLQMKKMIKEQILGMEACLWTEWISTEDKLFFHTFPRLIAFSDSAWRGWQTKDFPSFKDSLPTFIKWLDNQNINHGDIPEQNLFNRVINTFNWLKNKDYEYLKQKED
ncbi:MAG: beta-N-acetylhexosaminidase [Bacilli bacterium]